jgi:hypothetical protein
MTCHPNSSVVFLMARSLRGAVTFAKIVRHSLENSRMAFILKKVLTVSNELIGTLNAAIFLVNAATRQPVLKIILILIAALALMIVGFLIGEHLFPGYGLSRHPVPVH